MNNYKILQFLGDGVFGKVYMAIDQSKNKLCAVKIFKNEMREKQCLEMQVLKKLDHVNIVKILAGKYNNFNNQEIKERRTYSIVLEYAEKSLLQLYTQVKEQKRQLPEPQIKSIIYQIASGLDYLHQQDYFHRLIKTKICINSDLKPENVLICDNGIIKIIDFGQVQAINSQNKHLEYVSTRWYRAPEQLLNSGYSKEIDIWALGCIMAELFTLTPIFPGTSEIDQLAKIQNVFGNLDYNWNQGAMNLLGRGVQFNSRQSESNFLSNLPHQARNLIQCMLTYDPTQRITGSEILKHEWLKESYQFLPQQLVQEKNLQNLFMIEASPLIKKEKIAVNEEEDDLFSEYVPSGMEEIKQKPKRILRNEISATNLMTKPQLANNFRSASKQGDLYIPENKEARSLQQFSTNINENQEKQNPAFFSKPMKFKLKN